MIAPLGINKVVSKNATNSLIIKTLVNLMPIAAKQYAEVFKYSFLDLKNLLYNAQNLTNFFRIKYKADSFENQNILDRNEGQLCAIETLTKAMRVFWSGQAHKRTTGNNELFDHINPVKSWEIVAFDYLLKWTLQLCSAGNAYYPQYLQLNLIQNQWECITALHCCMLGRTRESATHLLRSGGVSSQANRMLQNILQSEETSGKTEFADTFRIGLCKLFDNWLVSGEMWDNVQLDEEEPVPAKNATDNTNVPDYLVPHSFEDFENNDPDNDFHESEKDSKMFHSVLGETLSKEMMISPG